MQNTIKDISCKLTPSAIDNVVLTNIRNTVIVQNQKQMVITNL